MPKVSQTMLFSHVQRYIREVYAERLKQAGFISYRNEDIHWYRLVNNDVLHVVYFVVHYPSFPVMLEIGYGCHPLFIPPFVQRSPIMRSLPGNEQMYHSIPELIPGSMPYGIQRSQLHGTLNKIYRDPDVLVHCPADDHTTQLLLDRVLSELDAAITPSACFEKHKCWRQSQIETGSWLTMTPYFVDEVLYWEDHSLYPYCMDYLDGKIRWIDSVVQSGQKMRKRDQDEYAHLVSLRNAFQQDSHQEYIQTLLDRARTNQSKLKKWIPQLQISDKQETFE